MNILRFLLGFAAMLFLLAPLLRPTPTVAPELRGRALSDRPESPEPALVPLTLVDPAGHPLAGVHVSNAGPLTDADGAADVPPGWVTACGWDQGLRVAEDDTEGRLWTLPPRCPVRLTFDTPPLPGSTVSLRHCPVLGLAGDLDLAVDCDGSTAVIRRPGHADVYAKLNPRARPVQRIPDRPGLPLTVNVVDPAGRPIPDAEATAMVFTAGDLLISTNRGGTSLWLPPDAGLMAVAASADDHTSTLRTLSVGTAGWSVPFDRLALPGPRAAEVTLTLHPDRRVRVACAGAPRDDCDLIGTATCGLFGFPSAGGDVLCPGDGPHVIRVAHRSVRVGPTDDVAWLDFRDDATLTIADPPSGTRLLLFADTLRVGRTVRCADTCVAAGLPPDRWWVCRVNGRGYCLSEAVPVDLSDQARLTVPWNDVANPAP